MNVGCKRLLIFLITTSVYRVAPGLLSESARCRQQPCHGIKSILPPRLGPHAPPGGTWTTLAAGPSDNDQSPEDSISATSLWAVFKQDLKRSAIFSLCMTTSGALLGPFLDAYHSAFGVLQYDKPIRWVLWGSEEYPALTTAWWVPELFGLAGFLIGWLYILMDVAFETPREQKSPSAAKVLVGISAFTLQYWLSGILFATSVMDRNGLLNLMSIIAAFGFLLLDGSVAGFLTSLATCIGGPLIEVGLITATTKGSLSGGGGYHYTDLGETGFFPLWIIPVYFLGGPANGNLARGFWNALSLTIPVGDEATDSRKFSPCPICQDTRRDACPNCDGVGTYSAFGGRTVRCTSCNARGFVMCRFCFDRYDQDPYDMDSIREVMNRMPD
jgi:hypothetical protein